MIELSQIKVFHSLFRGREDVFAIRWEKGNKGGYMPSYKFDPYYYRLHKAKGGTLSSYPDKTYQVLTDDQIRKHLQGEQFLGIYPLMPDNSSYFIASDFDGETFKANLNSEFSKLARGEITCGILDYIWGKPKT